jgi:mRNA-degrading endonuclease RelE of RelBE toxin-antitoxin system
MYEIELSGNAVKDLEYFKKFERNVIVTGVEQNLIYEPSIETKNRKPLRPNDLANWELRIDMYRVFYNIVEEEQKVEIVAVGWKKHNKLFIRGKEMQL